MSEVRHDAAHGACTSDEAAHSATERTVLVALKNGRHVLYQVGSININ